MKPEFTPSLSAFVASAKSEDYLHTLRPAADLTDEDIDRYRKSDDGGDDLDATLTLPMLNIDDPNDG